jgi:hypothetical protein
MTVRSVADLRLLFEKGDEPTQQDFVDLIDSFLHAQGGNFPNPLPAVSGAALKNIGDALPNPLPARDGSQLTGITPAEYNVAPGNPAPSYASPTSFVLTGDHTAAYLHGRRIELTIAGAPFYTNVESASFAAGITTVNITSNMPGTALTAALVSVIRPAASGGGVNIRSVGILIATQTLTVPSSQVDFPGLDGNVDVIYELNARFVGNGVATGPFLRFNDDAATLCSMQGMYHDFGANAVLPLVHAGAAGAMFLETSHSGTNGAFTFFNMKIFPKTGTYRVATWQGAREVTQSGLVGVNHMTASGKYWNSTANITKISIINTAANAFGVGSSFQLLALRP